MTTATSIDTELFYGSEVRNDRVDLPNTHEKVTFVINGVTYRVQISGERISIECSEALSIDLAAANTLHLRTKN